MYLTMDMDIYIYYKLYILHIINKKYYIYSFFFFIIIFYYFIYVYIYMYLIGG